jgi:hypothetical protein
MSDLNSPKIIYTPFNLPISTVFTFESVKTQTEANSVYAHKSTFDGLAVLSNASNPKKYLFKTDRERMLYIIGRQGTVPRASGY